MPDGEPDQLVSVEMRMPGFVMRFKVADHYVTVSSDSLKIASALEPPSIQGLPDIAIRICKKLPVTPITSMGHNFCFELGSDNHFGRKNIRPTSLIIDEVSGLVEGIESNVATTTRHTFSFEGKPFDLNISMTRSTDQKRMILFNFHYKDSNIDRENIDANFSAFISNSQLATTLFDKLTQRVN